ncbi:ATP-binding cassette domain-containing protein [Rickettsiales endosymbiont of Trichoplax sp. H2]|uniref:ATP-binding cassette domain-containing protein n=1 Tax=Rickettsiales endosymbiont of Trichoplax sp. H2 TaxID=2021221 RepID=UPI0012B2D9EF|nr:ATP-binding cassette domain-containing protein [Rickettsiales endosymbiont of Trichoplax sp. H2]MSO13630.1 Nucleotide-binding protein ExpZ [Rickettsiales endosymbiont of Trichoplax sp. H2]
MHKPILLTNVSLSFFNKSCFENFSTQIYQGSRIAIIGRNGSGKSSLLNILRGHLQPSDGQVIIPDHLSIGYVEQIISSYNDLSGGQRLNKRLSEALALSPDFLLLDEPTNNLDLANRKSLMHMLQNYQGTLIIISHDIELLRQYTNIFWHIDNNKIHIFSGSYDNYIREIKQKRSKIEKELFLIKHEKKETHIKLMKEQKRASKSKIKGQKSIDQRKWPTIVSNAKANRASQTNGKK